MRGWYSPPKQKGNTTEPTKTKAETCVELIKTKVKRAALEWDDFVLQEKLKSLMYVDISLCGDPKKYKLIDELNFKNCMCLKRNTISTFFVGIIYKKKKVYYSSIIF